MSAYSARVRDDITDESLVAAVAEKSVAAVRLLRHAARDFSPAAFSTSLGAEDMVVTDLIVRNDV
ncbi:MAG: phosphoadenylyl-sulfate reductase, partial [Rhodocyclales bacterium]|nr:phosphoadenylyl-sulfate reductase [Rhodocyclales bacterium]